MKKNDKLDSYELDILTGVEHDEWIEVMDIELERKRLKQIAIDTQQALKEIKIKINENDYFQLKKKGLETGIPYETIITTLIHNYTAGQINLVL